jgi:hypothetical protein
MFEFLELKRQPRHSATGYVEQGIMASYDLVFVTALYRSILTPDCCILSQSTKDEQVVRHSVFAQPPGTPDGHCFWTFADIDTTGTYRDRSLMLAPPHPIVREVAKPKDCLAMRIINTGSYFERCAPPDKNGEARPILLSRKFEQVKATEAFEPLTKHVDGLTGQFDSERQHADRLRDVIVLYQAFLRSEGDSVGARDLALGRMRADTVRIIRDLPVTHELLN